MERYGRLFKELINKQNNNSLQRILFYTTKTTTQSNDFPEFEDYPYTRTLYKKNYIKYNNLSIPRIDHDHVYLPHERLPTLEERLKEYIDPNDKRSTVNIGYALESILNSKIIGSNDKLKNNKNNKELEKLSRTNQLKVPIDKVNKDYRSYFQIEELKKIAEHYNLYKDLYDSGYFYPILDFGIKYKIEGGEQRAKNIYFGNKIDAKHTNQRPVLDLKNLDPTKYYTLTFMNLDGNLKDNNSEVLLWLISNINKEKNENGTELLSYIPPFPMKGTGWHRCAYILYEHKEPIDFNDHFKSKNLNNNDINSRTFKNLDFYLKYQNSITPVSFSFFQTQWDSSVRNIFHNILNMKEPVYEYDFGKKFIPAKEKYPRHQVFNWYIEDYKDIKDINEDVVKDYLKQLSPFEDNHPEPLVYPGIEGYRYNRQNPRWYKYEKEDYIFRRQKYSIIPYKYSSLAIQHSNSLLRSLPYGLNNMVKEARERKNRKRMEKDAKAKKEQGEKQVKTVDTKKQKKQAKKAVPTTTTVNTGDEEEVKKE